MVVHNVVFNSDISDRILIKFIDLLGYKQIQRKLSLFEHLLKSVQTCESVTIRAYILISKVYVCSFLFLLPLFQILPSLTSVLFSLSFPESPSGIIFLLLLQCLISLPHSSKEFWRLPLLASSLQITVSVFSYHLLINIFFLHHLPIFQVNDVSFYQFYIFFVSFMLQSIIPASCQFHHMSPQAPPLWSNPNSFVSTELFKFYLLKYSFSALQSLLSFAFCILLQERSWGLYPVQCRGVVTPTRNQALSFKWIMSLAQAESYLIHIFIIY